MLVTSKGKATTTKELIEGSIGVLSDTLESGHSEIPTSYLSAMAKCHYYSFGNILLIAMQKRDATRVAGMYSWNQPERRVKRGREGHHDFRSDGGQEAQQQSEVSLLEVQPDSATMRADKSLSHGANQPKRQTPLCPILGSNSRSHLQPRFSIWNSTF